MAKNITAGLQAELQSEAMETATCLLIELTRFTPIANAVTYGMVDTVFTFDSHHDIEAGDQVIVRENTDITAFDGYKGTVASVTAFGATVAMGDTTVLAAFAGTCTVRKLVAFSDHDQDITYDGITYGSAAGYTPSAIVNSGDMSVDNLDLYGLLDSEGMTEEDLMQGKYDFGKLWMFLLDYTDLALLEGTIKYGRLGEVSMQQDLFTAEFRGLTQALEQDIGKIYGPACDATLGDARCGIDLTTGGLNYTGAVTLVFNRRKFEDDQLFDADRFWQGGVLRWLTGNNAGRSVEIKQYLVTDPIEPSIQLLESEYNDIQVGDTYYMTRGCDKSLVTCRDVFSNIQNFRGFPHLPGMAELMNYGNRVK